MLAHGAVPDLLHRGGQEQGVAKAEMLAGFGGSDAGVGGKAVEMIEARDAGPGRKLRVAQLAEAFLKTDGAGASARIARGNGAADARVAAFEGDFADVKADDAALFGAEELVLPKGGDIAKFEGAAEAQAGFSDRHTGEPSANGVERGAGDDRRAIGYGIVGNASRIVAHDDGALEILSEPRRGGFRAAGKREGGSGNIAAIGGHREGHAAEVGRVGGANQVHRRRVCCVDQAAVQGIQCPSAVKLKAASGADGRYLYFDGVERLDGMDLDAGEAGSCGCRLG
jgi:hypothetical protein